MAGPDEPDSPRGLDRPAGGGYSSPSADGSVRADDWQVIAGTPGTPRSRPSPPRPSEYRLDDGVLSVTGRAGGEPTALTYGTVALGGSFAISMQARNVVACGIAGPFGESEPCLITLVEPSRQTDANQAWRAIEVHRDRGRLTWLVDGKPGHAIEGPHLNRGRLWVSLRPGTPCDIRRFMLSVSHSPRLPGLQRGQGPGRHRPRPPPGGDPR